MSQYLPTGDFKKIKFGCDENYKYDDLLLDEIKEEILNTPDDNEYGYLIECDLENPAEIKEKTENFPLCLFKPKQIQSCLQRT